MHRVGIYVKQNHEQAVQIAGEATQWLQERGFVVLHEQSLAEKLNLNQGFAPAELPFLVDLIIVLGGDGTLLSVAREVGELKVPILGVNMGRLGFLTEITIEDFYPTLEQVVQGEYSVSRRLMLTARLQRDGEEVGSYHVLNDLVINKGALARIVDMEVWVDDDYLTTFRADGLIVATPTGSTAYNLAAGGPIVYPGLECLLISPICPHMLTNRPIIVSAQARICILLKDSGERVFFTADGQKGMPLVGDERIEIRRSECETLLVKNPAKDYFAVLRTKLLWGEC